MGRGSEMGGGWNGGPEGHTEPGTLRKTSRKRGHLGKEGGAFWAEKEQRLGLRGQRVPGTGDLRAASVAGAGAGGEGEAGRASGG